MNENVNIPLLRKAVEWAEAEAAKPPELCEWEQDWWVLTPEDRRERLERRTGFDLSDEERRALQKAPECGTAYCIAGFIAAQVGHLPAGRGYVPKVAAEALGIDFLEAYSTLFSAGNTIEDVRRIAEEIAGERL